MDIICLGKVSLKEEKSQTFGGIYNVYIIYTYIISHYIYMHIHVYFVGQ